MNIELNQMVSVIVPVFNEGSHIVENLKLLLKELESYFSTFEVIIVSDGSTDNTNQELSSFQHPALSLLFFAENQGKGNAVRSGFKMAKGDYIFFIDGGMELHPKELRIFLSLMKIYDADIIVGSKRHPQSQVFYPWYRRFLSVCYQLLVRTLFKVNVTDTQVGIKLFKRKVIESILPHLQINRYGFDLEILSLATRFGYSKILEAPVRFDYFLKNKRFILLELYHVFSVGVFLLRDTIALYLRIKKIK